MAHRQDPIELCKFANQYRDSVVHLYCRVGLSNGFLVALKGTRRLIMTCQHCTRDQEDIEVLIPGLKQKTKGTVIHSNKDTDISLILVEDGEIIKGTPLNFCYLQACTGMDLVMLSFLPMKKGCIRNPCTSPGKVISGPWCRKECPGGPRVEVLGNYASKKGTSGGPVFHVTEKECHVIGMHSRSYQTVRKATAVSTISTTLKTWLNYDPDVEMTVEELLAVILDRHLRANLLSSYQGPNLPTMH